MEEVDIQVIFVVAHGPDMAVRFRAAERDRLLRAKQGNRIAVCFVGKGVPDCHPPGIVQVITLNLSLRQGDEPRFATKATYNLPAMYSTILAQFAAAAALNVSYSTLCDPPDLSEIARITTKGVLFR